MSLKEQIQMMEYRIENPPKSLTGKSGIYMSGDELAEWLSLQSKEGWRLVQVAEDRFSYRTLYLERVVSDRVEGSAPPKPVSQSSQTKTGWNIHLDWSHEFPLTSFRSDDDQRRDRPITFRATLTAPSGKIANFEVQGESKNGWIHCPGFEIPESVIAQFGPEDEQVTPRPPTPLADPEMNLNSQ